MADVDFDININVKAALDGLRKFGQEASKSFQQAADSIQNSFKGVSEAAKRTATATARAFRGVAGRIGKGFRNLGNGLKNSFKGILDSVFSLKTALAGIAGFFAGRAIFNGLRDLTQAASIQEDAINQLNTALRLTGEFTQETSQDFQDFASQLQSATKIGDEVALSQLALAKSFGASNEQAKALVTAAADLSAATGITLESAVRNLGKTFGGLTGELGEVVPDLKNLTTEALQSGAAIDFITERFGGAAAAEINTFSGATQQLANTFGDFQETLGSTITQSPVVISAIKTLTGVFQNLSAAFGGQDTASNFVDTFVSGIVKGIPVAIRAFGDLVRGLEPVAAAAFAIGDAFSLVFEKIAVGINLLVSGTIAAFDGLVAAVQGSLAKAAGFLNRFGIVSDKTVKGFSDSFQSASNEAAASAGIAVEAFKDLVSGPEQTENNTFKNILDGINSVADGAEKAATVTDEVVKNFDKVVEATKTPLETDLNINAMADQAANTLIDVSKSLISESVNEFSSGVSKLFSPEDANQLREGIQFASETFDKASSVAGSIGDAIGGVIGGVISLFDPENIKQISAFFGEFLAQLPEVLIESFSQLADSLDVFLEKFPEAATKAIEQLPEIFDKLFSRLPEIIDALSEALVQFLDKLPEIFDKIFDRLPAIFESILQNLPAIIESLLRAVGRIISGIIRVLPDLIISIVENLGPIIESLIVGLAEAGDEIAIAFTDFLVGGGIERIVEGIVAATPRIIAAVVRGSIRALTSSVSRFFSGDFVRLLTGGIQRSFQQAIENLDSFFSDEQVQSFFAEAGNAMGLSYLDVVQSGFERVFENLRAPLEALFSNIFSTALTNALEFFNIPVPSWIQRFEEIVIKFNLPPDWISKLEATIGQIGTTPAWVTRLEETVRQLTGADIFDGGNVGTNAKEFVTGGGSVGNILTGGLGGGGGIPGFADGGVVPPGFPNDTFLARLSSGETIIPAGESNQPDANTMLLGQIASMLARPQQVTATAEVDGEALANIILELNRNNARLA